MNRPRESHRGTVVVMGTLLEPEVAQRLHDAGFEVCFRASLRDARELLDDTLLSAIVLGPRPDVDRRGEIRALRARERLAFVQIVVIRRGNDISAGAAIDAGADEVFDVADESSEGTVNEQATLILARIARAERLSQFAMRDPLTDLHNRRFMNLRLPAEIARAHRAGTPVAIAVVDLDDFKQINDHFGHTAGDRALVAFARSLRAELRSYDIVCRFGGDEFVVLFPDRGAAGAHAALAELQSRKSWAVPALPLVSFSAGLAQFPDDGRSWEELFDRADHNVRRAKCLGRGRTLWSELATA